MSCWILPYEVLPRRRDLACIVGEHVDPCAKHWIAELDGRCRGCVICPVPADRHCSVCVGHLEPTVLGTCPTCRGDVRRNLREYVELATLLPTHALNAGHDGHLLAAAPIPGGDALVLSARGSEGLGDDAPTELLPPSFLLAWWEDAWRTSRGEPSEIPAWHDIRPFTTLTRAADYLARRIDWAASRYPAFYVFARDLKRGRGQLEELLHAGDQPPEGVPCFKCNTTLTRTYRDPKSCGCPPILGYLLSHHVADHARTDVACLGCAWTARHQLHDQGGVAAVDPLAGWSCPKCRREYEPSEYQLAVSTRHHDHAPALPASELAERLNVQPATIWQWANRGHVRRRGRASDGRTLYDVADALKHSTSTIRAKGVS